MKISIVIPAYNEEKYIGKTLESIQKLDTGGLDAEVLVIDGDSTDKTPQIAKSYGARVKHEPHKGIGFARQHGIVHANGDIILFTDADSLVPKNWVKAHVQALSKPGVSLSYGGYELYDGTFPMYHHWKYVLPGVMKFTDFFLSFPIVSGQNMAFWKKKAEEIGGFDQRLKVMEDLDFALRMKKTGTIAFLPEVVVYASGRRSKEGLQFYWRMIRTYWQYMRRERNLELFPDYR